MVYYAKAEPKKRYCMIYSAMLGENFHGTEVNGTHIQAGPTVYLLDEFVYERTVSTVLVLNM